ncbi:MAG TPA: single-stranded-DNA-specific exonuclease RecJ [Casimicrobiaceae bacterium]|nr:single-stranded-DNA-specific exonuclease RecJ [Casimicrobiaceae bacterium]
MTPSITRRPVPASAQRLTAAGVDPVLARLYASRGVESSDELDCTLAALPSPTTLLNIDAAAARLAQAIEARERIVIVADYDADGATACAVGVRGLRAMGADVDYLVPNRFEFGYGLTPEIVALAAAKGPRLIVTVDNGIASHDGVAAATQAGIDVLITDHHLPGDALPSPAIIVNPNQPACAFTSKHVAGVGVMFYVLAATRSHLRATGRLTGDTPNLAALLDLVALGTVADVVRLDHVNRILVEQGLRRMRARRACAGVAALFTVAGRDISQASSTDLGFVAGPRLNAAGRMADMSIGIQCLLSDDATQALSLATELDRLNRERRAVEATIEDEALDALSTPASGSDDAYTLCVFQPAWHQGVVGIVASRLKDRFHRPAIVFARGGDGELKGSGRSIAGLHLRDALDRVAKRSPGLVQRFGGHAFAAGVSIAERDLPAFAALFESVAREQLTAADLKRIVESDGNLTDAEICIEVARQLAAPVWGQGFAAPAFDDTFTIEASRVVGEAHTRLTLVRDGRRFDAILFRSVEALPERIHAVYRLEADGWRGGDAVQLVLTHWHPA